MRLPAYQKSINIIIFTVLIRVMSKSITGDEGYFISSKSANSKDVTSFLFCAQNENKLVSPGGFTFIASCDLGGGKERFTAQSVWALTNLQPRTAS